MQGAMAAGSSRVRASTGAFLPWLTLGLMLLWQAGAHVDAWYHLHFGFAIETFFTWPHALFYAGWLGTAAAVALNWGLHAAQGARLPRGYRLALLGTGLFAAGGLFDLLWHTVFGFEVSLETLITPSHTWLLVSYMLAAFGLLLVVAERHVRDDAGPGRRRESGAAVMLSLAILFRATLWSLAFTEPLSADYAAGGLVARSLPGFAGITWESMSTQVAATTGLLLHSVLLALFLVAPLRSLRLPAGAVAVVMLWDGLLVSAAADMTRYLPAVAGAALVGEATWAWVRRGGLGGPDGEAGYWLLAALTPAAFTFFYFALMATIGGGVTWTLHLWAGLPVLAGLYGLVVGLLAVPPRFARALRA